MAYFAFFITKRDKKDVWDNQRSWKMKWHLSDFGEKQGFPNYPQNHRPCPHLKLGDCSGDLSPKIPKSLVFLVPKFSSKNLKTLSPSPPCPQMLGTGKGIFDFRGHTWTPYQVMYTTKIFMYWWHFKPSSSIRLCKFVTWKFIIVKSMERFLIFLVLR